ncbi:hypothetical protein OS493_031863 [Desmophyllum pertusum]|uniref:Uncharacterized protein n=1 Tax=Desmophyllum pertusum TaxID=174260 RepID=A0A9W9Y8F6_9CNID|nr:hypothetical protein OS493_031863 [Desmophyllum pertusum]
MDHFVSEVNEAIREGKVLPKSKMAELIPRIATLLHVFNHSMVQLLAGTTATPPSSKILAETLENATAFVKHLECQKDILCQFVKEVTNPIYYKTIEQPTSSTLKESILSSSGPLVTYRAFKHGKRSSRSITEAEYCQAAESLQENGFGRIVEFRVRRATANCKVFIKSKPEPYPSTAVISSAAFDDAFSKAIHKDITAPMRAYLNDNHLMPQ